MPAIPNPRFVYNSIPDGLPIPGETTYHDASPTIDPESVDLQGGFLLKTKALSLDPYMRNRMRQLGTPGELPPFEKGETITGFAVGEVVRSDSVNVKVGEHVYGFMPYQAYNLIPHLHTDTEHVNMRALGLTVLQNEHNLPWRHFAGTLGMTGQTAYYGLKDISSPKPGETLYVSAASGAVGHLVVQLAKRLGLKVIASVGSDEKVELVKGLGADHVFNRKTADTHAELAKDGPIDIYFDNVGGSTLEAAIANAALRARFVLCGAVGEYNKPKEKRYGVRNLDRVVGQRIKIEGLVVIDWDEKYSDEFYATVPRLIASGELRPLETVYHGLESAGQGLLDVLSGAHVGKAVVVLEEPESNGH